MSEEGTPVVAAGAEPAGPANTAPPGKKPKAGGRKKELRRVTRQRRTLAIVAAVEIVLLAGAVALAVIFYVKWDDQRSVNDLRRSATAAAGEYALDFSTYDYQHLDQDFQTVTAHLAPSFRDQYTQTVASLKAIVVQYKGTATATVQGVGVTSVDTKKAVVLVFLDQKVTNTNLKAPRIDTNRLQITLERSKGRWLMSDLQLK